MNNDLGVWTYDDCALVLIDYQNEMFEVIRSETDADLVELNVRLLAKTAKAFDVPIVLSTVGVGYGFNGPTLPSILSELDGIEPIDRSSMNAFEDDAFRAAVEATGRKRLIIAGLHTEICLDVRHGPGAEGRLRRDVRRPTPSAVDPRSPTAPRSSGSRTPAPCRRRRSRSPPSCSATGRRRLAGPALEVIHWYFREVAKAHRCGWRRRGGEAGRSGRAAGSALMAGRLADKVCVITGSGGGMGRATALTFAREGALVVGCDVAVEPPRRRSGWCTPRAPRWSRCSRVISATRLTARGSSNWRSSSSVGSTCCSTSRPVALQLAADTYRRGLDRSPPGRGRLRLLPHPSGMAPSAQQPRRRREHGLAERPARLQAACRRCRTRRTRRRSSG